jgi:hypothetical protein
MEIERDEYRMGGKLIKSWWWFWSKHPGTVAKA